MKEFLAKKLLYIKIFRIIVLTLVKKNMMKLNLKSLKTFIAMNIIMFIQPY